MCYIYISIDVFLVHAQSMDSCSSVFGLHHLLMELPGSLAIKYKLSGIFKAENSCWCWKPG